MIPFVCLLAACGADVDSPYRTVIVPGPLPIDKLEAVLSIAYGQAGREFADAEAVTDAYGYRIEMVPAGESMPCSDGTMGCETSRSVGVEPRIYVRVERECQAYMTLMHEMVHAIGHARSLHLGCTDQETWTGNSDCHRPPYFMAEDNEHSSWEWCGDAQIALSLCSEHGYRDSDLNNCQMQR